MTRHWLAVASAEHVRRGRAAGFMQVCHGKAAPLRRLQPGDGVVTYSPTATFGGTDRLQAFTALGIVEPGDPYRCDTGGNFRPYRRNVAWTEAEETPIRPLLDALELTAGRPNWGYQLRFGLVALSAHDFHVIAAAMRGATRPAIDIAEGGADIHGTEGGPAKGLRVRSSARARHGDP